jgi:hypothetical protein
MQPAAPDRSTRSVVGQSLPQTAVDVLRQGRMSDVITRIHLKQNIDANDAKNQIDAYLRAQLVLKCRLDQVQSDGREEADPVADLLSRGLHYFLT